DRAARTVHHAHPVARPVSHVADRRGRRLRSSRRRHVVKTRFQHVGDHPPRTMRGKMLIPATLIPPTWRWGGRLALLVFMVVTAPVALPVVGWWFWGMRRRRWVWPHAAVGLATTLVVPFLVRGVGVSGVGMWLHLFGVDHPLARL